MTPLLSVHNLKTYFFTEERPVKAVDGVSFTLERGGALGIVGESGSGKSVTALSIMGLVPSPGRIVDGEILLEGEELRRKDRRAMSRVRGSKMAMIFQDPTASLNPVLSVGFQIAEALRRHQRLTRRAARARAIELLDLVGIADPMRRVDDFPHQLSGGMRQRVMIAMALSCDSKLLIADEPTTALDVTIQAQILELLRMVRREFGTGILLITHDLGVIAEVAQDVVVMRSGRIVERTNVDALFKRPQHPYTVDLIASLPDLYVADERPTNLNNDANRDLAVGRDDDQGGGSLPRGGDAPHNGYVLDADRDEKLLEVRDLVKHFTASRALLASEAGDVIRAVDGISFHIAAGESLALLGESGCGKSTTGRLILRLLDATSGKIKFSGRDLATLTPRELREQRREMQIVFQDSYGSLNPRMTVGESIGEPLRVYGNTHGPRSGRVAELLEAVGLSRSEGERHPHELSGGQRQRVGIARALALRPKLVVCDEPVSSLDRTVQTQVLRLFRSLQREMGLAYLFIAHDLGVVSEISDRVAVMYLGKIVEVATTQALYRTPLHPYTKALFSAVPRRDPQGRTDRLLLETEVPSALEPPSGCRFRTRCPLAGERCAVEEPLLKEVAKERHVACHFVA